MKRLLFLFIICSLFSCEKLTKSASDLITKNDESKTFGRYHTIKQENIKVYLPEEFEFITLKDYKNLVNKSNDTLFKKREVQRLDVLEKSNQNIYFFEHIESGSILNILPTKYVLFNKQDATYMLSIVNSITKQNSPEGTNLENIAAEFKKSNNKQIFKAIYKFRIPGYEIDYYKYVYFISHNRKSALINLETPILTNFDEYIFKMKL
jgi:hypothetical protein